MRYQSKRTSKRARRYGAIRRWSTDEALTGEGNDPFELRAIREQVIWKALDDEENQPLFLDRFEDRRVVS